MPRCGGQRGLRAARGWLGLEEQVSLEEAEGRIVRPSVWLLWPHDCVRRKEGRGEAEPEWPSGSTGKWLGTEYFQFSNGELGCRPDGGATESPDTDAKKEDWLAEKGRRQVSYRTGDLREPSIGVRRAVLKEGSGRGSPVPSADDGSRALRTGQEHRTVPVKTSISKALPGFPAPPRSTPSFSHLLGQKRPQEAPAAGPQWPAGPGAFRKRRPSSSAWTQGPPIPGG